MAVLQRGSLFSFAALPASSLAERPSRKQNPCMKFADVLESAEALSLEEKENLVSVLQNRLREERRVELIRELKEADREFRSGRVRPALAHQIMKKICA